MNIVELQKANCRVWEIEHNASFEASIAEALLVEVFSLITPYKLRAFVFFGTLLGLKRGGALIKHDKDVDIALGDPTQSDLATLKAVLRSNDYYIFRDNEFYVSVLKKGVYIDIYKFYTVNGKMVNQGFSFETQLIYPLMDVNALNANIVFPRCTEELLALLYGETWRLPQVGLHAEWEEDGRLPSSTPIGLRKLRSLILTLSEKSILVNILLRVPLSRIYRLVRRFL